MAENTHKNTILVRVLISLALVLLIIISFSIHLTFQSQKIDSKAIVSPTVTKTTTSFRFISWGDTKTGTEILSKLSSQAVKMNPQFTIFTGDLQGNGFTLSTIQAWRDALNAGCMITDCLFNTTFAVRGNHDSSNTTGWQSYFDFSKNAVTIGAKNYTEQVNDATYTFEYQNAVFIAIDSPGDFSPTKVQTDWVDQQLIQAEEKGLTHAFIFTHGPFYYVDGHPAPVQTGFLSMLDKHPIVSATFHGHEHVQAYVHMDNKRVSSITHQFEQFVTGAAGAGLYSCDEDRSEWCEGFHGFAFINVSGPSFTVSFYQLGNATAVKSFTFSK